MKYLKNSTGLSMFLILIGWVYGDSITHAGTLQVLPVPSDPKATYVIIERGGSVDRPTLTTNRVDPVMGDSYAIRIFDCRARTAKYLASSDTLKGLKSSKPDKRMGEIIEGSIVWYQYNYACPGEMNK